MELDLFINLKNINDNELFNKLCLELKKSIVSEWKLQKSNNDNIFDNDKNLYNYKLNVIKSNDYSNDYSNIDINNSINLSNFENYIINGISNTNKINEFDGDIIFDVEKIDLLTNLHNNGVQFDMRFNLDHKIKINSNEILFPMCCVGKNRSQFMFYYLKKLQGMTNINFEVGYPSSGDELSVLNDYILNSISNSISNSNDNNKNILSSFFPQYKKDNFSKVIGESLDITNLDGLNQISRSIHIFDKILKIKQEYLLNDLKNFETNKYKENKYNIFDDNPDYLKIKILFEKYFLLPNNLLEIINYDKYNDELNKINKITYICMSDKSFLNICKCLNSILSKYPNLKLYNIRIIYFGIKDIFQKSTIKQEDVQNFKKLIDSGFCF